MYYGLDLEQEGTDENGSPGGKIVVQGPDDK